MKIMNLELAVEIEGDFKPGKSAVQPHAGNPDGSPPEGPEIKITRVLVPAESSVQVDILPVIDASTLVEIEDWFQEQMENESED